MQNICMLPPDQSDTQVSVSLRALAHVARILRRRRADAGALQLASPEVRFEIDTETHDPLDVGMYQARVQGPKGLQTPSAALPLLLLRCQQTPCMCLHMVHPLASMVSSKAGPCTEHADSQHEQARFAARSRSPAASPSEV